MTSLDKATEHVVIAIQFLINGEWVTIEGWQPKFVQNLETCQVLAANVANYVRGNPHPEAENFMVSCYVFVADTLQSMPVPM